MFVAGSRCCVLNRTKQGSPGSVGVGFGVLTEVNRLVGSRRFSAVVRFHHRPDARSLALQAPLAIHQRKHIVGQDCAGSYKTVSSGCNGNALTRYASCGAGNPVRAALLLAACARG